MSTGAAIATCLGIGAIFAGMIATMVVALVYAIREGEFH